MGKIFFQGNIRFCACRRYGADFYNDIKAGIGTSAYGIQPVMARVACLNEQSRVLEKSLMSTGNMLVLLNVFFLSEITLFYNII